eukprot:gene11658-5656_t
MGRTRLGQCGDSIAGWCAPSENGAYFIIGGVRTDCFSCAHNARADLDMHYDSPDAVVVLFDCSYA